MDRTAYKTLLETKTKQVANLFTGSAYWDTENEGMLYAMDWIPQSGSIKLLEMNTNIGLTGRMIACVDLGKLTSHITSSGHSTCTYYLVLVRGTRYYVRTHSVESKPEYNTIPDGE